MDYFMDRLEDWEVTDIYNMLQYADASDWEQTRWLMYVIAQVNSKKQLKVDDILKFPWDGDSTKQDTTISDEEIERLRARAKMMEKKFQN